MLDFQTSIRKMPIADPEDRTLGSNPSAAVGDGNSRSKLRFSCSCSLAFPMLFLSIKAINPSPFATTQPWVKPGPLTRPVCHMAIFVGLVIRERNPKGRFSVLLVIASAAKASRGSPLKRAANKIATLPSRKTAGLVTLRGSRLKTAKRRFI
jgi:hypothetical protein